MRKVREPERSGDSDAVDATLAANADIPLSCTQSNSPQIARTAHGAPTRARAFAAIEGSNSSVSRHGGS
jgi:hypothetical protein